MNENYKNLALQSKKITLLRSIAALLDWDLETYMPTSASPLRGQQRALIEGLIHKENTSEDFEQHLFKLIDPISETIKDKDLTEKEQANVREWKHDFLQLKALPTKFVEEFVHLTTQAISVWKHAKKESNFALFAPTLDQIISMSRKKADYLSQTIKHLNTPYDALLHIFEPFMTAKQVDALFTPLSKELSPLIKKLLAEPPIDNSFLYGTFPEQKQLQFAHQILASMGFSPEVGRLDTSEHPFATNMHPTDSRITTRFDTTQLFTSLSAAIHEGGHALYFIGLPPEEYGTPLCETISYAIDESQSRFWETFIGQSRSFWQHFYPLLIQQFPSLKEVSLDNFYCGINKTSLNPIRIHSDEVSYSMHIILRFQIEKQLIEGTLKTNDIPEAWNAAIESLGGIASPKHDAEGCLQDIHWGMGAFGYFPSYALGNLYAAQFFSAFEKSYPQWKERVSSGNLTFIKEWLHLSIHRHGRFYSAKDLVHKVTGSPLSINAYTHYLKTKYSHIYNLQQSSYAL